MLVGGSSRVLGLRMADVMGLDASDILVCTDPERTVSSGASEYGFDQDPGSQSLECGLGVMVFDRDAGRHRHLLLISPGQILPPEGLFVKRHDLEIGVMYGCSMLVCKPFVCRSGVLATVVDGRDTFPEERRDASAGRESSARLQARDRSSWRGLAPS